MRATKSFDFLEALPLDGGSKKRLSSTLSRLKRDEVRVLRDGLAIREAQKYELKSGWTRRTLAQLHRCYDPKEDLPFGRSVGRYESMKRIWLKFLQEDKADFRWNVRFRGAIQKVLKRYAEAHLRILEVPHTVEEARALLSDLGTSGGYESIVSGKQHKGDLLDEEYVGALPREFDKARENGRFDYPIIPGYRTQCTELPDGTCKHKKRPINMVTLVVVLAEALYANPINTFLKNYKYSAIGKDGKAYLSPWCTKHRTRGRDWLSLDYSSYDATIPAWLIDAAFDVLTACFDEMTPEQNALWDAIRQSFIVKDLITPEGILHVTHGNPSGSKFTAIVNGVCNEIMTEYWADVLGREVEYVIMGDDNLIFFTDGRPITESEVKRIADILTNKIGIEVQWQKAQYGNWREYPEFLSCLWTDKGQWRSPRELLSLIAYPERWRDYRGTALTVDLLLYSYILSCEAGMREWFDVDQFMFDHPNLRLSAIPMAAKYEVPYIIRVKMELSMIDKKAKQLSYRRNAA
jgi:hypothetical protein